MYQMWAFSFEIISSQSSSCAYWTVLRWLSFTFRNVTGCSQVQRWHKAEVFQYGRHMVRHVVERVCCWYFTSQLVAQVTKELNVENNLETLTNVLEKSALSSSSAFFITECVTKQPLNTQQDGCISVNYPIRAEQNKGPASKGCSASKSRQFKIKACKMLINTKRYHIVTRYDHRNKDSFYLIPN